MRNKNVNLDNVIEKLAGVYSEYTGALGTELLLPPVFLMGAIPAAFTDTKTKKEMLEQQKKTWSNFIPGVGAYRVFKRLGYNHEDLKKEVQKLKNKQKINNET